MRPSSADIARHPLAGATADERMFRAKMPRCQRIRRKKRDRAAELLAGE
jgi:hypothetical protein